MRLNGTRAGGYVLESEVGRGAHGVVWLARNHLTGSLAAVKVLRDGGDPAARGRLIREGRAASVVRHGNVVRLIDVSELASGEVYVAMEYIAGRTLQQELDRRGALPPADAFAIVDQVAAGVGALHAAGILHRDIKPGNVMLADDGRVVVLDLGLAKLPASGDDGRTDVTVGGTPGYTAPEQAAALRDVDARADVYSIGMLAVRMLTGATPFVRAGGDNGLLAVLDRARSAPHELHAALNAVPGPAGRWRQVLARATAYDRAARQAAISDLMRELGAARAAQLRGRRWQPWAAAAAAAGAAAVAGITVGGGGEPSLSPSPAAAAAALQLDAGVDAAPPAPDARVQIRRPRTVDAGGVIELDLDRPVGPL